jgi:DNA-binding transcriptional MerR regulator
MSDGRSPRRRSVQSGYDSRSDVTFTLDELCEQAGVTVRTVRYYISEGLLPPPTGHGASTRYVREHLDRLRIIDSLKEQFLPLREIRRSLDRLSGSQIRDTADLLRREQPHAPKPDASVSNRTDEEGRLFIQSPRSPSLEGVTDSAPPPPAREIREESDAASYIADVLDRGSHQRPGRRHQPPDPEPSSWRRIRISEEAEFLIEEQAYQRRREQIESLVTWAKRILNGT